MADENGDKTEDATPRRLEQARKEGNVPMSRDMSVALLMLASAMAMRGIGPSMFDSAAGMIRDPLAGDALIPLERDDALNLAMMTGRAAAMIALPFMATLWVASLLGHIGQVGVLIAPDSLKPKLARLNPIKNAQNILSSRALMKLAVSVGKLTVLSALAAWGVASFLPEFMSMPFMTAGELSAAMGGAVVSVALQLAAALIGLALLDVLFQRWKHAQDLKMTKQEVRDEMKEMEGDPLVRHRRREAHRKLAEAKELAAVPHADVVLTNPTHYSIAVRYDAETMPAPVVVAKGVDAIALRIREIARENDVPIVERPSLARQLWSDVKTGQAIPLDLYEVFVEILAYVYQMTGKEPAGPNK